MIELGLGLVGIGRPWGVRSVPPPAERDALALLEKAVALRIRLFDTAPAYGASEAILGRFLRTCATPVLVATKMGEEWDAHSGSSVDHNYDALARSIDRSLSALGRIDLLQVHKSTAANLRSAGVARAVDYARNCGVQQFGASISDLDTARAASEMPWCSYLQFPFNRDNSALAAVFGIARERGLKLLVNRPMAMGAITSAADAFRFVRSQPFSGAILTGTSSIAHLVENHRAFHQ